MHWRIKPHNALILTIFISLSCKEKGYTDADATNFDMNAKEDDNSCEYQGEVLFWFQKDVSDKLIYCEITELTCYIYDSYGDTYAEKNLI
jgi:hypothetical protein